MSGPSARELLDSADGYDLVILATRVEKVLALHKPIGTGKYRVCEHCGDDTEGVRAFAYWPCPTVRALNGDGK